MAHERERERMAETRIGPRTFTVPIEGAHPEGWVLIRGDWPMTEQQWGSFKRILDAMRPGLVEPLGDTLARQAPQVVAEAYEETFGHG